jgi:hypothetical protein
MEVSGQLHAPAALPPGKEPPGAHWIGGWVGPRAVLDAVVKRKIPSPHRKSNPRTPIVQPVAQRYSDWAITALIEGWKLQINFLKLVKKSKGKFVLVLFLNWAPRHEGVLGEW